MQVLQLMMLVLNIKCKYCKVFQIMNVLIGHKLFTIGVLQKKTWQKNPFIFQCERWMGLMFCKYTKFNTYRRHIDHMFDDVILLIQILIAMEEVLHFH